MTIKNCKSKKIIFLAVLSSNKGSSNSIRNNQILLKLKKNKNYILTIDFGDIFNVNNIIYKLYLLIFKLIKSFFVILFNPKYELIISTNPKWLLIVPYLLRKNFILYLGDPFIGDVAKKNTFLNTLLWKKSRHLILRLFVFSPFLYDKFKLEGFKNKLVFLKRSPIPNLPKMTGDDILYLGDFSSVDRNFLPLLKAIEKKNIKLHIFGQGNNRVLAKNRSKISIFERKPLKDILNIIPKYKILVIILNKSGLQVPGKLYDFINAPFPVLILYEDYLDISMLPLKKNYIYCKNKTSNIKIVINELL